MKFHVANSLPAMADQLAEIQRASFPGADDGLLMTAAHYRMHPLIFPEGQFCVLGESGAPVACATTMLCRFDLDRIEHRYMEMTGDNTLRTHEPDGEWLYFNDIGVHPDWRGHRLGGMLYDACKNLVRSRRLRGFLAGALIDGWHPYRDRMSVEAYLDEVEAGRIFDMPTSIHLRHGFTRLGVIQNYALSPKCDNKGVFLVWRNPDYTGA